jgi:hypothetical protein
MAQKNRQLAAKFDRSRREAAAFVNAMNMAEACRPAHKEHVTITARHVAMRGTVKAVDYKMTTPGRVIATHW